MNKIITTFALAILLATTLAISGCGQAIAPVEIGYEQHILGTWYFVTNAPGLKVESNVFFHKNGNIYGSFGQVTIPEIPGPQAVDFSNTTATWSVSGNIANMTAQNGRLIKGTFSDAENMSGSLADANGVNTNWTATKTASYVVGKWTINLSGYGEGEIARFQNITLNVDGTADVDWQKVQTEDGQIYEGEIPDYLDTYNINGDNITITSNNDDIIFFGEFGYDDQGNPIIEGDWKQTTGESGTWYGVSME